MYYGISGMYCLPREIRTLGFTCEAVFPERYRVMSLKGYMLGVVSKASKSSVAA